MVFRTLSMLLALYALPQVVPFANVHPRSSVPSMATTNCRARSPFMMTPVDASEGFEEMADPEIEKVSKRKQRLTLGYRTTAAIYAYWVAQTPQPITAFSVFLAQGSLMSGVIAWILAGATKSDRLGSDTYKRLNLALVFYGLCDMSVMALMSFAVAHILCLATSILTAFIGYKGYRYGVLGFNKNEKGSDTIINDLKSGMVSTFRGLSSAKNARSVGYLTATVLLLAYIARMKVPFWNILQTPVSPPKVTWSIKRIALARQLSTLKRFSMLTFISYTLKDAADRRRLSGSTFVTLGYVMAGFLGNFAVIACPGGKLTKIGTTASLFSIFAAFNSISSTVSMWQRREDSSA